MANWVSRVVSCLAGGEGLELDCVTFVGVFALLWVLLEDLVGGGGGSTVSPLPLLRLNPLRLRGRGGNPCKEDIAILSSILQQKNTSRGCISDCTVIIHIDSLFPSSCNSSELSYILTLFFFYHENSERERGNWIFKPNFLVK